MFRDTKTRTMLNHFVKIQFIYVNISSCGIYPEPLKLSNGISLNRAFLIFKRTTEVEVQ